MIVDHDSGGRYPLLVAFPVNELGPNLTWWGIEVNGYRELDRCHTGIFVNPTPPDARYRPIMGETLRAAGRWLLGLFLLFAGIAHLTVQRSEFQAQVPEWVPVDADLVVVLSGLIEMALGLALLFLTRHRTLVGWLVAGFFVAIFPGNVAQYLEGTDAFGLDTDRERLIRLFFQPVLIAWALWSTEAWRARRISRGQG